MSMTSPIPTDVVLGIEADPESLHAGYDVRLQRSLDPHGMDLQQDGGEGREEQAVLDNVGRHDFP